MAFHLESIATDYVRSGMSQAEAEHAARRRFGNILRLKEAGHDVRTSHLDELVQDARSGLRQLTGAPAFAVMAVVTLALGIGANTAIFAVVKSALLDALPYRDADSLVRVYGGLVTGSQRVRPVSAGTVMDIAERQLSFTSLSAFTDSAIDAVYGGDDDDGAQVARMTWVEPGFFDTLGVPVALGRTFHQQDALNGLVALSGGQLAPDAPAPVILTDTAWSRLFASDTGIVGREVRINGIPRTVIGVLPRGFFGPMGEVDFYFAFDLDPVRQNPVFARRSQWLGLIGRMKPGVTPDTSREEVAAIWANLVRRVPGRQRHSRHRHHTAAHRDGRRYAHAAARAHGERWARPVDHLCESCGRAVIARAVAAQRTRRPGRARCGRAVAWCVNCSPRAPCSRWLEGRSACWLP